MTGRSKRLSNSVYRRMHPVRFLLVWTTWVGLLRGVCAITIILEHNSQVAVPITTLLDTLSDETGHVVVQGSPTAIIETQNNTAIYSLSGASFTWRNLTLRGLNLSAISPCSVLARSALVESAQKPTPVAGPGFLLPSWLRVAHGTVVYDNVLITTDCATLRLYQEYICAGAWTEGIAQVNATHIVVLDWRVGQVVAHNLVVSCHSLHSSTPIAQPFGACALMTVNTATELYDAFQAQHNYLQVVIMLKDNITLNDEPPWNTPFTPVAIYRPVVIQGQRQALSVLNFNQRVNLMVVTNVTGLLMLSDLAMTALRYEDGVNALPVARFGWDAVGQSYVTATPNSMALGQPFVYVYNMTEFVPCDYLELLALLMEQGNSLDPVAHAHSEAIIKLGQLVLLWSESGGILFSHLLGMKTLARNLWVTCDPPPPPEYEYSGVMELTDKLRFSPWGQMYGVMNASALLQRIAYAQTNQSNPSGAIMVFLANVTFADLPYSQPPGGGYANVTTAGAWPITITISQIWGRWQTSNITIDFAYRAGLFKIMPGVKVQLLNLTLVRLPCLCDGSREGLWAAGVWPFTYDRTSTPRLSLQQVTLALSEIELEFMDKMMRQQGNITNAAEVTSTSNQCWLGNLCAHDWPDNPCDEASLTHNCSKIQVPYLTGLGHLATSIMLTKQSLMMPLPDDARHIANATMFEVAYNASFSTHPVNFEPLGTDQDGSNTSSTLEIVLGCTLGVLGLVVLIVVVVAIVMWHHRRHPQSLELSTPQPMVWARVGSLMEDSSGSGRGVTSSSNKGAGGPTLQAGALRRLTATRDSVTQARLEVLLAALQPLVIPCGPHMEVDSVLGQGATSKVFHGWWLGVEMALKVVPLQPSQWCQAAMELAVLTSIAHPNIITCHTYEIKKLEIQAILDPQSAPPQPCAQGQFKTFHNTCSTGTGHSSRPNLAVLKVNYVKHMLMAANSSQSCTTQSTHARGEGSSTAPNKAGDEACQEAGSRSAPTVQLLMMALEYCTAGTLDGALFGGGRPEHLMMRHEDGRVRWEGVLSIAVDITKGLHHLHTQGLVHGDLKPSNVLLHATSNSTRIMAKLSDFGLSLLLEGHTHRSGINAGTMYYAAPELLMGWQLGRPADIYALGLVLWELCHGHPPWLKQRVPPVMHSASLLHYDPACLPAYADLCKACTSLEAKDRPTSAQVLAALDDIQEMHPAEAGSLEVPLHLGPPPADHV